MNIQPAIPCLQIHRIPSPNIVAMALYSSSLFAKRLPLVLLALTLSGAAMGQSDSCQRMSIENSQPSIQVVIEGNEYPALLTTSNVGSSITRKLVRELKLPEKTDPSKRIVSSFGRDEARKYVSDVPLTLFGSTIEAEEMTIVEGSRASITLSLRIFEDLVIQLNFPNSEICFFPRSAIDLQKFQNIDFDSDPTYGNPVLRVSLNEDLETWLTFSPSYSGGLLVDRFVARELELQPMGEDDPDSNTLSSLIGELTFGPFVLGDVPVAYPRAGTRDNLTTRETSRTGTHISSSRGSRGRIGLDVLQHFVITFDLGLERMHVGTND